MRRPSAGAIVRVDSSQFHQTLLQPPLERGVAVHGHRDPDPLAEPSRTFELRLSSRHGTPTPTLPHWGGLCALHDGQLAGQVAQRAGEPWRTPGVPSSRALPAKAINP